MTFGDAIQVMKDSGQKVRRAGWNGKGMWLCLVPHDQWGVGSGQQYDSGHISAKMHPWIGMKAVDGSFFPWNPNQLDMLSEDWEVC